MTTTASTATTRRGSQGWLPNQHGAWAMLVVPWLLGMVWVVRNGGPVAASLLLLAWWLVGYFAFFATSQWLRSRFRPRYLPAVRTYACCAVILSIAVVAVQPHWWSWGVVFGPLVVLSLWLAWRRRDRGLLSGVTTVGAASLMPLVLSSHGAWPWTAPPEMVGGALVCFGYFFGTVLYVKTIIRERGNLRWVVASTLWHVACMLGSFALPEVLPRVLLVLFFALMAARAWLVPWYGPLRGRNVTAKAVGIGEFGATAVLLLVLLIPW